MPGLDPWNLSEDGRTELTPQSYSLISMSRALTHTPQIKSEKERPTKYSVWTNSKQAEQEFYDVEKCENTKSVKDNVKKTDLR